MDGRGDVRTVRDGELDLLGEADEPWFCWSNENRDWSEPESMNFE